MLSGAPQGLWGLDRRALIRAACCCALPADAVHWCRLASLVASVRRSAAGLPSVPVTTASHRERSAGLQPPPPQAIVTIALLFVFLLAISALVMVTVMQARPPRLCARAHPPRRRDMGLQTVRRLQGRNTDGLFDDFLSTFDTMCVCLLAGRSRRRR